MKSLRTLLFVVAAIGAILNGAPVGAQTYEGASLEEGIFYVPADFGPGADINFAVAGLMPDSELIIQLLRSGGTTPEPGLTVEVQGAVVVRADAAGNFNGNISLPSGLDDGTYVLSVTGTNSDGSDYLRDLAIAVSEDGATTGDAAQTSGDTQPESLALTGSSSRSFALNGLLIVGVGIALVAFAARKDSSAPDTEGVNS